MSLLCEHSPYCNAVFKAFAFCENHIMEFLSFLFSYPLTKPPSSGLTLPEECSNIIRVEKYTLLFAWGCWNPDQNSDLQNRTSRALRRGCVVWSNPWIQIHGIWILDSSLSCLLVVQTWANSFISRNEPKNAYQRENHCHNCLHFSLYNPQDYIYNLVNILYHVVDF